MMIDLPSTPFSGVRPDLRLSTALGGIACSDGSSGGSPYGSRSASRATSPVFGTETELAIGECDRVVQDMGFPYIHFFHTYFYA